MRLDLKECWDELYEFSWRPDEESGPPLRSLLRRIENQLNDFGQVSDWLCLRGYIWYCLHEKEKALQDFRVACKLNPDDGWAAMYVAHCLQDGGMHEEALDQANSISMPNAYINRLMELKLEEIKLCCYVRMGRSALVQHDISEYLHTCAVDDVFPTNLRNAICEVGESFTYPTMTPPS